MNRAQGTEDGRTPEIVVLAGKLAPPAWGRQPVLRRRLLDLLDDGIDRTPVTLLSGPAGSGKSVLAASWMHEASDARHVAWLSLDEHDDRPATFWTYLVEALVRAGVELSDLDRPLGGERPSWSSTTRLSSQLLATDQPIVLIIDNADCLTDREILDALDLLVQHAGSRLRLVLCARADPGLPLHRYRVADTMTEIRADQLAFTAEELQELLAALGAPVSPADAEALREQTAGWAAGIRLAAEPLKRGLEPEQLVTSLAEDDGSVAQYLFEEVLRRQPARVRLFLLRISVTSELWPELVDRLSGERNGRRVLASLARANAFVEQWPTAPGGYRIHPLFQEMLRAQLRYEQPDTVAALHRACAAWYARVGALPAALEHAVAADDWQLASALLVDDLGVGPLLSRGSASLPPVLDSLPDDVPGADAAVIRAASALAREQSPDPGDLADAATAAADPAGRLQLRATAAVVCAVAGAHHSRPGTDTAAVEELLRATPATGSARRELSAVLIAVRAAAQLRSDAEEGALVAAQRAAAATARDVGALRLRRRCLSDLALLEALQGHLTRAEGLVRDVEVLAAERGGAPVRLPATAAVAAAWVHLERHEVADARRWLVRAQSGTTDGDTALTAPLLAVLQSRMLRARHDMDAAERILRDQLRTADLPRWVWQEVVLELARTCFARNRLLEGVQVLREADDGTPRGALLRATADHLERSDDRGEPVLASHGAELPLAVRIQVGIARACLRLDTGDGQGAVGALEQALGLGEPERLRRPFLDAPAQARWVLRSSPQLGAARAWLSPASPDSRTAGPRAGTTAAPVPQPLPAQPLSERELEVLNHLAEMLSTEEIGAAMFISVNTVRTHVRSILRKLSADRRSQAVRRARELNVI